jgi:hypothetical protein
MVFFERDLVVAQLTKTILSQVRNREPLNVLALEDVSLLDAATELSMTTSSNSANAYGAQMAKYFTMNQPPHVAIDSAVSVVRPQMAITRLFAVECAALPRSDSRPPYGSSGCEPLS